MQRRFAFDTPVILTVLTVLGMLLAVAALWPLTGVVADRSSLAGLCLVYLAGGLPAAWRALEALWKEQILDIDLLMVVAAVAAAAVGAPFEGGGLLTLFSGSTTPEQQALRRAPRAFRFIPILRPYTRRASRLQRAPSWLWT